MKLHHCIEGEVFRSPNQDPAVDPDEIVTLEMKVGGLVIFNNLVFHR